MELTFYGADHAVTGSCHCVTANGRKLLIDCGLQQGRDETDNSQLPFSPSLIDAVLVTHAHIDHSGRLPLLVKLGYKGPIYATAMTCRLLEVMLMDSAHIQESDAEWMNRKGQRSGAPVKEPLYTIADAQAAIDLLVPVSYGQEVEPLEGFRFRMVDAGHLLGSACIELWVTELDTTKKLVFSGDIGNLNHPVIRDPQPVSGADYVITESTYGDRNHEAGSDYRTELAAILNDTFARGGNVVIPSFAVGRTQELLYYIREIKEQHLVTTAPSFQVVVDSPLAVQATRIFSGDLTGYLDDEAIALLKDGVSLFQNKDLRFCQTSEESKALNGEPGPKVIISASGMCDAGRIRHHLKHNLWKPECSVVFVGYQGEGTLGRALLEGKQYVKLFGEDVAVRAKIFNLHGLSSHADHDGLIRWIDQFAENKPHEVFVVHGDETVCETYAKELVKRGFSAHAPEFSETYDLFCGAVKTAGVRPARRKTTRFDHGSAAYRRLEEAGRLLLEVIRRNKGGTNKDLAKFTDQILALIHKWDR